MGPRDELVEAAYAALRTRIAAGRFAPRARLSADSLAQSLHVGVTPTRIALHWLHRDGLVDHWPGDGFFAKTPSLEDVRSLLVASRILLDGAARMPEPRASDIGVARTSLNAKGVAASDALFLEIASRTGSELVMRTVDIINARLRPAREAELDIFDDLDPEREAIAERLAVGHGRALATALARYHRRRLSRIADIAERTLIRSMMGAER